MAAHTNNGAYSVPPDYYEKLRREALLLTRSETSNLDVVVVADNSTLTTDIYTTLGYCHMPYFFPFSFFPEGERVPFPVQGSREGATAIHLAMMHLNTGDGSVVQTVAGLSERCPLRFTFELGDTEMWEATTINQVVQQINRKSTRKTPKPCAFLGAGRSAVTMPMSIITGVSGYAQMSGISTSSQLDDRSQYKHFARLIPSDDGTAIPVILYLRDIIQTQHLAVLHDNNIYSMAFLNSLLAAKTKYAPTMNVQSIDIPFNDATKEDLQTAVQFLKDTECRYIFSIVDGPKIWDRLMTEAYHRGITDPQYTWIHTDSLFPETIAGRDFPADSPLAHAARGTSMLTVQAGLKGAPVFDRFLEAFQELSHHPEHLEFIQSKVPVYDDEEDYPYPQVADIFDAPDPGGNAIFLYDATIAMGLAACAAMTDSNSNDFELTGQAHYQHIVNTTFVGVSGEAKINPNTGTRDPSSALFQVINFVPSEPSDGVIRFEAVQSDLFENGTWTSLQPYIYGDGTSNIPPSLPVVQVDENHIATGLRVTGLLFSVIVMGLAIGFGVWTVLKRKERVVCASQPIFLLFVCVGVFLMGAAIIPLSIDDAIASQAACTASCMLAPWLFSMGFAVAYAALFSKTWRVNRIFHTASLKRVKITAQDVIAPFVALALANALILSLWTGLAPLQWEREVSTVDKFGQTVATQGRCHSDDFVPFFLALAIVNLGALGIAAFQAYQARGISLEFAESEYIGKAIFLFLLACFYGIPVLAIVWDDPSARYFVLMALATVCSLSVLLLIFVPKVLSTKETKGDSNGSSVKRKSSKPGLGSTFVSGLDTGSVCSKGSDQSQNSKYGSSHSLTTGRGHNRNGLAVLDAPNMREALQRENLELKEQKALLEGRVRELELNGPPSQEFRNNYGSQSDLFGEISIKLEGINEDEDKC